VFVWFNKLKFIIRIFCFCRYSPVVGAFICLFWKKNHQQKKCYFVFEEIITTFLIVRPKRQHKLKKKPESIAIKQQTNETKT